MKKELQLINKQTANQLILKMIGLIIAGVILSIVIAPAVSAQEEDPAPGQGCDMNERETACADIPPAGFYTCKAPGGYSEGTCVCRWGKLESKWGSVFSDWIGDDDDTDVCNFIQSLEDSGEASADTGTRTLLFKLTQMIVSLVTAITVMAGLVILVASGYVYMTAGGDASRVQKAKAWMGAAIAGIILSLLGYTLLRMIATNLINFPG
jgi:hypothetical protein